MTMFVRRLASTALATLVVLGLGCKDDDDDDGDGGTMSDDGGSAGDDGATDSQTSDAGSDGASGSDSSDDGSSGGSGEQAYPYRECADRLCFYGSEECLLDDVDNPTFTVCGEPCQAADTCPSAPSTGDAPAACVDIIADPASLFCVLDCSAGQTCPDGMHCHQDVMCVW
jgi:hypothetical protein